MANEKKRRIPHPGQPWLSLGILATFFGALIGRKEWLPFWVALIPTIAGLFLIGWGFGKTIIYRREQKNKQDPEQK